MEEGFPGEVRFEISYILNDNNLEISYLGVPDKETIINLTNHSYFNLSGNCKENILNHELFIDANKISSLDKESIPHGDLFHVEGTPFDFRTPKKIGKDINSDDLQLKQGNGYDHPFILNKEKELEISLFHKKSGRKLEVYTDREAVVLYTANYLGEAEGMLSCKVQASPRLGVCLETQELPNNINIETFKSSIYTKENPYRAKTNYKFTN
jgi:aldose 1-epimerase